MFLHICLVPGIINLFRLGRTHDIVFTLKACLRSARTGASSNEFFIEVKDLAQAIDLLKELIKAFGAANQNPSNPNLLAFSAIYWQQDKIPRDLWSIAPPGMLLYPSSEEFSMGQTWFYGFSCYPLCEQSNLYKRILPLPSLLILGAGARECFFCGSRDHSPESCPDPWGRETIAVTVKRLSEINPKRWGDEIALRRKDSQGLDDRLRGLRQDLRREFQWRYADLITRTTAIRFCELGSSPVRPLELVELRAVLDAASNNDPEQILFKIRTIEERASGANLLILKGLCLLMKGSWDKALSCFWQAENLAQTPLRRQYACLLQMRMHLLRWNLEGARSALSRGMALDRESPQLLYWQAILECLSGRANQLQNQLTTISLHPRWLIATILEPLLLRYQPQVEQNFLKSWSSAEQDVQKGLSHIDKLLEMLDSAFGQGASDQIRLELRNWRAEMADAGYAQLISSSQFFGQLNQRISELTAKKYRNLLARLHAIKDRMNKLLIRLPRSNAVTPLRKECQNLIAQIVEELEGHKKQRRLEQLIGFHERVKVIEEKASIIDKKCQAAIESYWTNKMIKRYITIGLGLVAVIWLGFYFISILLDFLGLR